MIPQHDQMIVTSERVFVAVGPILQMPPTIVYEIKRATLSKIDTKRGRIQLKCEDGTEHSTPLENADDAPLVLETLAPGSQSPSANLDGYLPAAKRAQGRLAKPSFKADHPPRFGATVPADCVWATTPYPGPLKINAKSAMLRVNRIAALDPIARPLKQIISCIGKPDAVSTHADGTFLHQWQKTHPARGNSYHLALTFDRYGVCSGITQKWIG